MICHTVDRIMRKGTKWRLNEGRDSRTVATLSCQKTSRVRSRAKNALSFMAGTRLSSLWSTRIPSQLSKRISLSCRTRSWLECHQSRFKNLQKKLLILTNWTNWLRNRSWMMSTVVIHTMKTSMRAKALVSTMFKETINHLTSTWVQPGKVESSLNNLRARIWAKT